MPSKRVTIDANVIIGICAREADKYVKADAELERYANANYEFHVPAVFFGEVLYALCRKKEDGFSDAEIAAAEADFLDLATTLRFDANGDVPFLRRAIAIRQNYGCAKSNDSIYLALTEDLMTDGVAEMVTFDERLANQAKANAPNVKVNLLTT